MLKTATIASLMLSLASACYRTDLLQPGPPGGGNPAGTNGADSGGAGASPAGGAGGATTEPAPGALPVATFGDDGVCGADICNRGQQCCLSTGVCVDPATVGKNCPPPAPKQESCGGILCQPGQICCFLSGKCVNPATVSTDCPRPVHLTIGYVDCASNADCKPTEFCGADSGVCLGQGVCMSRSNCGSGSPVCGCDGVTYQHLQDSCRVGVRYLDGPCSNR